jgi:ribonuclease HI
MHTVIIYTDGACKGNPGRGGIAYLIKSPDGRQLTGSQGYQLTTSNRMELMAAIEALKRLKCPCEVTLYTDSRYLADSVNKGWLKLWLSDPDFMNRKNEDLWRELNHLLELHQVIFIWVKGHSFCQEHNLVDRLAVKAAMNF